MGSARPRGRRHVEPRHVDVALDAAVLVDDGRGGQRARARTHRRAAEDQLAVGVVGVLRLDRDARSLEEARRLEHRVAHDGHALDPRPDVDERELLLELRREVVEERLVVLLAEEALGVDEVVAELPL